MGSGEIVCGRYSPLTEDEIIEVRSIIREVSLKLARDEFENYEETISEIAPTNHAPVVTSNGEYLALEHAQFGFTKWDGKGVIINARSETIHEKSIFKNHIKTGRCVIPASGYFEWKPPDENQKKKIKHFIKDSQGNLLFMAGLWREGNDGKEFVVITKEPYGDVSRIHDRMPVMLRTDQLDAWLSGAMPIAELASLNYECMGEPCEPLEQTPDDNAGRQMTLFD